MTTATISRKGSSLVQLGERQAGPQRGAWFGSGVFILLHVACLAVLLTGTNVLALALCVACYFFQIVGVTAGYHRYFSHRSYKTSRPFQFVLAWLGCSASQKGPLWWAAQHRHHHRTSDTPEDLHSPVSHSLWWSHIGWVLSPASGAADRRLVKDLSRYPELCWLDRYHGLPPLVLAGLCFLVGSWSGLVWGFFVSSVLSHHATFLVNSACHLWGRQRYATADASRNNLFVALLTMGEGWHNNHHHYQSSANQGFRWWEIDVSYYLIRLLACGGLVWDVRKPPRAKLLAEIRTGLWPVSRRADNSNASRRTCDETTTRGKPPAGRGDTLVLDRQAGNDRTRRAGDDPRCQPGHVRHGHERHGGGR
ncbi:MAG TPA: acyl-CoA desaturase [Gemmataceae bacterium]|nr:acyl-CoA desaturase [Gemmataceae bacterium]